MKISTILGSIILLVFGSSMLSAQANSVGLDATEYNVIGGEIVVTLTYDFTDFGMFGGGVDVIYDPLLIEFVSYTRGPFAADVWLPASPTGSLVAPGNYQGPGIGAFPFFNGITSSGDIGTFVFSFLGFSDNPDTPCGSVMCLSPNAFNPFVSVAGQNVDDEVFANGISSANIVVPVPAAVWFLLSGLGMLVGVGRTKRIGQ